jgi:hypothetical protein
MLDYSNVDKDALEAKKTYDAYLKSKKLAKEDREEALKMLT